MLSPAVTDSLNTGIVSCCHLGRGAATDSFRVELDDGRTVFAKTERADDLFRSKSRDHSASAVGSLWVEAANLRWLERAQALAVPEVLAIGTTAVGAFLILEWVDEADPSHAVDGVGASPDRASAAEHPSGDDEFGRALARLHRSGARSFGRDDGAGNTDPDLRDECLSSWADFYSGERLQPLIELAGKTRALPHPVLANLQRVADRVDLLVGPREPPARLHGALTGRHRLVDRFGRSWLVAPKSFGGDREFDLAVMRLSGGFDDDCYRAYDDVFPLSDGWQRRLPLYQLAPLIEHAVRSGGHHIGRLEQALLQLR